MKHKLGDLVSCKVEEKNGQKRISVDKGEEKKFEIILVDKLRSLYTIAIDDDMVGWTVSQWHVKNAKIDEKFVGKKFYDITEDFIK